jgi:hypothetical protein
MGTDTIKPGTHAAELVAVFQYRFFTRDHITYEDFLKFLKLHTLHDGGLPLDPLFFIFVYSGLKCYPFLPHNFTNSSCLLLLVKSVRLRHMFRLLTACANT